MVWFLVLFLAFQVVAQLALLVALLNRLLVTAKVAPIVLPQLKRHESEVEEKPRRKVMSVPLFD